MPATTNPPYALSIPSFRFAALAALAGRAQLGGQREVALATYMAARLAHDVLPERSLPSVVRAERISGAKSWLGTIALPASVRPALLKLVDATAGDRGQAAEALRIVTTVTAPFLDARARAELDRLVSALDQA